MQYDHAHENILEVAEDHDSLGFYPDGVKRTLTKEQVNIFRHSEIHGLLRERRLREEEGPIDEEQIDVRVEEKSTGKDSNPGIRSEQVKWSGSGAHVSSDSRTMDKVDRNGACPHRRKIVSYADQF